MQSAGPSTDSTGAWSMRSVYSGWPLELGVRVSVTPSPLGADPGYTMIMNSFGRYLPKLFTIMEAGTSEDGETARRGGRLFWCQ